MILQALAKYYERMIQDEVPDLEPAGYKRVGIPFVLVLRKDGSLAGIDDTRKGNGRRTQARPYIVPKVFDGSRTSDVEANLLWDKASYVFGLSQEGVAKRSGKKRDKFIERLKDQQGKFLSTISDYFPNQDADDGVRAVVNFLKYHADSIQEYREWEEIKAKDPNLAFRLEGEHMLICNREAVNTAITKKNELSKSEKGLCLITGCEDTLAELENPIKGLRGSGKAESHLAAIIQQ